MIFLNFKKLQKNHVIKYFNTEVNRKAMFGPFKQSPFKTIYFSPLMA